LYITTLCLTSLCLNYTPWYIGNNWFLSTLQERNNSFYDCHVISRSEPASQYFQYFDITWQLMLSTIMEKHSKMFSFQMNNISFKLAYMQTTQDSGKIDSFNFHCFMRWTLYSEKNKGLECYRNIDWLVHICLWVLSLVNSQYYQS
jgi:hypothetical protein